MKYNPSGIEFKVELEPGQGGQFVFDLSSLYAHFKTLKEDRCRLKIGHAARTMATLSNLVLVLILRQGYDYLPQAWRRYAARPLDALQLIMQNPHQRL